jgi:hypothetical protein
MKTPSGAKFAGSEASSGSGGKVSPGSSVHSTAAVSGGTGNGVAAAQSGYGAAIIAAAATTAGISSSSPSFSTAAGSAQQSFSATDANAMQQLKLQKEKEELRRINRAWNAKAEDEKKKVGSWSKIEYPKQSTRLENNLCSFIWMQYFCCEFSPIVYIARYVDAHVHH